MSFLNGLSAAGSVLSDTAGKLSLESQKAQAQQDLYTLADQLQGDRESAGRVQAAGIAMTAAQQAQGFQASQLDSTEAGANARSAANNATSLAVANIGNQGLPEQRAAQTAAIILKKPVR